MTLDEARGRVGRLVRYHPVTSGAVEIGEVVSVNAWYVFVRYIDPVTKLLQHQSKATRPEDLEPTP